MTLGFCLWMFKGDQSNKQLELKKLVGLPPHTQITRVSLLGSEEPLLKILYMFGEGVVHKFQPNF